MVRLSQRLAHESGAGHLELRSDTADNPAHDFPMIPPRTLVSGYVPYGRGKDITIANLSASNADSFLYHWDTGSNRLRSSDSPRSTHGALRAVGDGLARRKPIGHTQNIMGTKLCDRSIDVLEALCDLS